MPISLPKIDPRIAHELNAQRKTLILGLLCSAVAAILVLGTAAFIKEVLAAIESKDGDRLILLSGAVIVLFGVKYFFTRGQTYYLSQSANRLTTELRIRLFDKLQRLPISYFNEKRAGNIQSVLTNDVNVFQTAVAVTRDAIDGPIKVVGGFAYLIYLNWQLTLAAMVVLPFMVQFIQRNARKMRAAQAQVQADLGDLTAMTQEAIQGTRLVKAFAVEDIVTSRFRNLAETSYGSLMVAARRVATLKPMVELIGAVGLAVVVLVCGMLVKAGALQVSGLAAFLFTLDAINQGFKNLGSLNQTMASLSAACDRIYGEVLDVPIEDQSPGTQTIPHPKSRIEFENVSFAYPDGTKALEGVSFVIEPGTSLALVGYSGAGKSTIADLLLRFYDPTAGRILFDGVDIRELDLNWLRKQIGVVPQQTFLFADTIANNLRLGDKDASDEDLREAAQAAYALEFIERNLGGFDKMLGERGTKLSGGEAQRLAIARALVRKPSLLILDEATSNLDAQSEKIVQSALDEIMVHRTTLFIAHRLSTAARATHVLVLARGKLVEYGTPKQLIEDDGMFAHMYGLFVSGITDETIG